MIPILGVMAIGSLGETLSATSSDVPRSVQFAGGFIGAILFAALLLVAVKAFSERWSSEGSV
jgi:hypothetical protein